MSFAAVSWAVLWAGINTGPWNLKLDYIESGWREAFNGIRALFPLGILALGLFSLMLGERARRRRITAPEALWLGYGAVCLLSSLYSDRWFAYAYWGFAYLSVFAAVHLYMREGEWFRRASELNRLNWLLCSVVLATLAVVAREYLLAETPQGVSGYAVFNRVSTVAGMAMVRSTGISRMAAVPAIVAFVALWESRGYLRWAWGAAFAVCFYLVWVMQSRGSTVSLACALALIMVLLGGRARLIGWTLLALAGLTLAAGFVPNDTLHGLYVFATRGTHGRQLFEMSGRTRIFHREWNKILESPLIGYGPQADRKFGLEIGNAQNGILYALLCGGFVGGAGYVGGLLVAWTMLVRALRWRDRIGPAQRTVLLQVAAMMTFFTLRSFPENCAALYSVDLLIQLPALVYIGEFNRAIEGMGRRRSFRRGPSPRAMPQRRAGAAY